MNQNHKFSMGYLTLDLVACRSTNLRTYYDFVNSESIFYLARALLTDQPTDRQTIWWTNWCLVEVVCFTLITYYGFDKKKRVNDSEFLHLNQKHLIFPLENDLISILSLNNSYDRSRRPGILFLLNFFLLFLQNMVIGFFFPRPFFLSFIRVNSSASSPGL